MSASAKNLPVPKHARTGLYVKSANGLKLRSRKVTRLVNKMYVAMPWLEDADEPACRAWAQFEILAAMAFAILEKLSIVNAKADPRRLLTDYRLLRQTQLAYERDLGMTPAARMAIKATGTRAAFDIAGAMAREATEDAEEVQGDG